MVLYYGVMKSLHTKEELNAFIPDSQTATAGCKATAGGRLIQNQIDCNTEATDALLNWNSSSVKTHCGLFGKTFKGFLIGYMIIQNT